MYTYIIIIAIIIGVLFVLTKKYEHYDPMGAEQYMKVPSFEPEWMKYNWAYYDPIRYKYGYQPVFPYFVPPYPYFMKYTDGYFY